MASSTRLWSIPETRVRPPVRIFTTVLHGGPSAGDAADKAGNRVTNLTEKLLVGVVARSGSCCPRPGTSARVDGTEHGQNNRRLEHDGDNKASTAGKVKIGQAGRNIPDDWGAGKLNADQCSNNQGGQGTGRYFAIFGQKNTIKSDKAPRSAAMPLMFAKAPGIAMRDSRSPEGLRLQRCGMPAQDNNDAANPAHKPRHHGSRVRGGCRCQVAARQEGSGSRRRGPLAVAMSAG